MTPLRRTLSALAAALIVTGGVAAATPDASPHDREVCGEPGWTAYAPLQEPAAEETYSGYEIRGFVDLFCGAPGARPEGWPPGAQPPAGWHPEIQIIR